MHFLKRKFIGFTLIELIIVVLLISVISATVIARWPGMKINLNAQTHQLMSAIRYTQSLSMTQGQRYQINLQNAGYSITDINGNSVIDPVTGASTTNFPPTITLGSLTNLPNNLIAFDALGQPYTDSTATTPLSASAIITLNSSNLSQTIHISPQTGRLTTP